MAHFRKQIVLLGVIAASFAATAKAQYYELANQIPQMIQPALSRVLQNSPKKLSKSLNFHKLRLFYVHKI